MKLLRALTVYFHFYLLLYAALALLWGLPMEELSPDIKRNYVLEVVNQFKASDEHMSRKLSALPPIFKLFLLH